MKILINMKKSYYLFLACYLAAFSYGGIYLLLEYTQFTLNGSAVNFGNFLLISGISTVLMVGISGVASKKYGANIIASIGILLCGISFFIISLLNIIAIDYYVIAIFIGLGWSFYHASSSMIVLSSSIKKEEKGKYLSLISVFIVIGTATLPVIYNIIIKLELNYSLRDIYQLASASALLSSFLFIYIGYLFNIKKESINFKLNSINWTILTDKASSSFIMVFLGACIFSIMMTFQVSYAKEREVDYAIFFIFYTLAVILSRVIFGGVLTKNNPIVKLPLILSLMIIGLLILIVNYENNILYGLSAVLIGTSYGLAYPLIKTYSIKVSKIEHQHQVIAIFTLSYFIGVYFFPIIASYLFINYSSNGYLAILLIITLIYILVALKVKKTSIIFFRKELNEIKNK
ncbi:MFS transporter [Arcobacteraceae bacterium]|nr:MFS transporter [Arcobacteraceae bacterium]